MADPGSNNVVRQGADIVHGFHDVLVDLTGLYDQPVTITLPDGSQQTIPPPDVVFAPRGFIYAYDEFGRRLDPRRFAGPGGTPLDPGAARSAPPVKSSGTPPARPQPVTDWSAIPGLSETVPVLPSTSLPEPPPAPDVPTPVDDPEASA